MSLNFLITLFIIAGLLIVNGAAKRKKPQSRKIKTDCHFSQIDKCMTKLINYNEDKNSSLILTSSKGLDEICTNSLDSINCIVKYIEGCGTGLHQELFELASEQFTKSVDNFCKSSELRNELLNHSLCIVDKLILNEEYKNKCNKPFLATIDTTNDKEDADQRLSIVCCSYLRWRECLNIELINSCGEEAKVALDHLVKEGLAGFMDLMCNDDSYLPNSIYCKRLYAPPETVVTGKLSENPITRYFSLFFGFLVN